jgi:phage replication O-like protein O
MANPQLEHGHTRIANEILDRLIQLNLPGQAFRIVFAIIRKTYGWRKKYDQISYSQFSKITGIGRKHVGRSLKKLINSRVILKKCPNNGTSESITYLFNKNWEEWRSTPIAGRVSPKREKGVPPMVDTKETTTKENNKSLATPGIQKSPSPKEIVDKWLEHIRRIQIERWGIVRLTYPQINILVNPNGNGSGRSAKPGFGSYHVLAVTLTVIKQDIDDLFPYLQKIANDERSVNVYIKKSETMEPAIKVGYGDRGNGIPGISSEIGFDETASGYSTKTGRGHQA